MINRVWLWLWAAILRLAPTISLQEELGTRPGVTARFLYPGETAEVKGICWLTVNEN